MHYVGDAVISVVLEAHDEPDGLTRQDGYRVLPVIEVCRRRSAVDVEDAELHVVYVEVVRHYIGVGDLPHFDVTDADDRVDSFQRVSDGLCKGCG